MSGWAAWTWVAIAVLTMGSSVVFVWFLFDLLRIRGEILREEGRDAEGNPRADD